MKGCPFCGSTDLVPSFHQLPDELIVCVSCDECDAEGPPAHVDPQNRGASIEVAHKLWNARVREAQAAR